MTFSWQLPDVDGRAALAAGRRRWESGRRQLTGLVRRLEPDDPAATAAAVARGLGWFSIALGAAELVAPRWIARLLGIDRDEPVIRAYGAREIATGLAILAGDDPKPWVWGRVGGDAIDLVTLAAGFRRRDADRAALSVALAAVAAVTVVDLACAMALSQQSRTSRRR